MFKTLLLCALLAFTFSFAQPATARAQSPVRVAAPAPAQDQTCPKGKHFCECANGCGAYCETNGYACGDIPNRCPIDCPLALKFGVIRQGFGSNFVAAARDRCRASTAVARAPVFSALK